MVITKIISNNFTWDVMLIYISCKINFTWDVTSHLITWDVMLHILIAKYKMNTLFVLQALISVFATSETVNILKWFVINIKSALEKIPTLWCILSTRKRMIILEITYLWHLIYHSWCLDSTQMPHHPFEWTILIHLPSSSCLADGPAHREKPSVPADPAQHTVKMVSSPMANLIWFAEPRTYPKLAERVHGSRACLLFGSFGYLNYCIHSYIFIR